MCSNAGCKILALHMGDPEKALLAEGGINRWQIRKAEC